jgi:uncharacterized phage-associated protein
MVPYQKEKIENAICYFASEHYKATRKPLTQTYLYKYLAFLDFKSLEDIGKPALGLEYIAMERGPVPIKIYGERDKIKSSCFEFKNIGKNVYVVMAKGKPDLDFFSDHEIREMKRLIEIYADRFVHASDMSEASHQDIKAWKKAWKKKPNSMIDYDLAFDENILSKPTGSLSFAEECYLTYKALEKAC